MLLLAWYTVAAQQSLVTYDGRTPQIDVIGASLSLLVQHKVGSHPWSRVFSQGRLPESAAQLGRPFEPIRMSHLG